MSALWTPHDLLEATGGAMETPFAANGVSIDTRSLQADDLFVALRGEAGDGHAFVADAMAKGAAGAMVHRDVPDAGHLLLVDDTLAGLHRLGGYARHRYTGQLIAVTGSVGKTTTKEMLRTILATFGHTHAAVASYNNHWGLPLTLARLPPDAAFCVAEIGMNHAGEIAPLAQLAQPHVAVITAIEAAHIGYLGSIEAIADEKASLLRALVPDGVAVLPAELTAAAATADGSGYRPHRDVRGEPGCECAADAAERGRGRQRCRRRGAWASGALPAQCAWAAHGDERAGGDRGRNSCEHMSDGALWPHRPCTGGFSPVSGRGARRPIAVAGGTALLLDESYNGNPASIRAALAVLRLQPAKRRVAVLGDMLELGEAGPAEHRALAGDVAAACGRLFTCGPLMAELFASVPEAIRGAHAQDSAALAPIVAGALAPGDAVLIKGSLGSRMKLVVNALTPRAEAA